MPLLLAFFLGALVWAGAYERSASVDALQNWEVMRSMRQARDDAQRLGAFAFVAQRVMQDHPFTATSPSSPQVRTWYGTNGLQTLAVGKVPQAILDLPVPANWRVVGISGEWVMCTPLPEGAIAHLAGRGQPMVRKVSGSQSFVFFSEVDDAQKSLYQTWCATP